MSPSKLSDVVLPVREVTLTGSRFKTRTGEPMAVRCEGLNAEAMDRVLGTLRLAEAAQGLPGAHPPSPKKKAKPSTDKEKAAVVRKSLAYAGPVIEAGCYLTNDAGRLVQAFCFCGEHPDAIPGRLLGPVDSMNLFTAVMEEGGYVGGAVEAARFHDEPGGGAAGAGTVGASTGNGNAAGGSPGGSDTPSD